MNTHAFLGVVGLPCAARTEDGVCGRHQLDDVHDVNGATAQMHRETTEMLLRMAEGEVPSGRVYGSSADAPAEDGGGGSGSWAFTPVAGFVPDSPPEHMSHDHNLFRCGHPDCVRDAELAREPVNEEETFSASSARFLSEGSLMTWGPWPVRQFVGGGGGSEDVARLIGHLMAVGEPWFAECWWMNVRTSVVRVQWGSLLTATAAEVLAAVASWPE